MNIAAQQFQVLAPFGQHEIVGEAFVVREKVPFDGICLVAEAEDEVVMSIVGVILHNMPQDRAVTYWHHRLGQGLGVLAHPHAEATAK